jgi:hypothetical protein
MLQNIPVAKANHTHLVQAQTAVWSFTPQSTRSKTDQPTSLAVPQDVSPIEKSIVKVQAG